MIKNPTKLQLKKLKGIVYLIKNKLDGKCYIGKTKHRFSDRYSSSNWIKYTTNKYLKNAVIKHGIENFKVSILKHGILDNEKLLNYELKSIEKYNSIVPNGYNFVKETGEEHREFSEEMRLNQAISQCKGKIYKIKEISTGEIKEFRCPKEIIDKYKIKEQNLNQLFIGSIRRLKGICLPETNPEQYGKNSKLKTLVDQYGKIYQFYNCSKFGRENKCGINMILQLCNEKCLIAKSKDGRIFRLEKTLLNSTEYLISTKEINVNQKYKTIILTKINDNTDFNININEIHKFCKTHNISKREIYTLTNNEQKTSKGFKLKNIIYL